jgi:hypothetical protein
VAARSLKVFVLPVMSLTVAGGRSGRYGCCAFVLRVVDLGGELI